EPPRGQGLRAHTPRGRPRRRRGGRGLPGGHFRPRRQAHGDGGGGWRYFRWHPRETCRRLRERRAGGAGGGGPRGRPPRPAAPRRRDAGAGGRAARPRLDGVEGVAPAHRRRVRGRGPPLGRRGGRPPAGRLQHRGGRRHRRVVPMGRGGRPPRRAPPGHDAGRRRRPPFRQRGRGGRHPP
ncbi:MAG: Phosphoribosylanthranilate isomerase, partial [uncultured Gemmatimonadetes bacterium]